MSSNEELVEDANGDSFQKVKQNLKDRSKKVAQTKEMFSKQAVQTKQILSKQAVKIAKQAEEHERFINKVGLLSPVHAKLINGNLIVLFEGLSFISYVIYISCLGDSSFGGPQLRWVLLPFRSKTARYSLCVL
ncbi:hypothetical protein FEM48_Zijuj06G0173900 [Ziziphus jujuba var. spinosa]|uniref:Uncharacterized protein n=1 Tax=Ziziphus jujuba var. spinosa TaxID=714518 RepID=A0A978VAL8_ZIZJJ|nr:hypothetical protein FEM48_Zijuj06G0173900 [Ziziphus jujuba var. spinosa]